MGIKNLMSGIAVVIDDALNKERKNSGDNIFEIVKKIERECKIPFYKTHKIPPAGTCNNLLQSASFVLLDWKLWRGEGSQLAERGIERNIKFLEKAKDFFMPVFIFTNEHPEDVAYRLPESLYDQNDIKRNFIFVKRKSDLMKEDISNLMENWMQKNASVYTLKTWEQAFYESKINLFSSMYKRSPDWPKVFWESYKKDGVNPSSSMTHLINGVLLGNIKTDIFEEEVFSGKCSQSGEDVKSLMNKASFIKKGKLTKGEARSGDLFMLSDSEYSINIRPDCDCIPRDGQSIDSIELYCIKGIEIEESMISQHYNKKLENFRENINENISFNLHEGKTIRFNFNQLEIKKFSVLKRKRVGRLIHPYITRMQQRYALYLQRQGLPRVPEEAIPPKKPKDS